MESLNAKVCNNVIVLHGVVGEGGGIDGIGAIGVDNAVVRGNCVCEGQAHAGIYFGVYGDSCTGWTISGNIFPFLRTTVADFWLGAGTSNRFVSVMKGASVLDQGSGNIVR